MSVGYIDARFRLALRGMAMSPESLHDRLRDAWRQLRTVRADEVTDPALRQRFNRFWNELTNHFEGRSADEDRLAHELCDLADTFRSLSVDSWAVVKSLSRLPFARAWANASWRWFGRTGIVAQHKSVSVTGQAGQWVVETRESGTVSARRTFGNSADAERYAASERVRIGLSRSL